MATSLGAPKYSPYFWVVYVAQPWETVEPALGHEERRIGCNDSNMLSIHIKNSKATSLGAPENSPYFWVL